MQKKSRMLTLLVFDISLIVVSYYVSLWLRFDGNIEMYYWELILKFLPIIILIKILVFVFFRLYRSLWEYASVEELMGICFACFAANTAVVSFLVLQQTHLPRSIYLLSGIFDILFVGGIRLIYRTLRRLKNKNFLIYNPKAKKVFIIGAGDSCALVIKELRNHYELNYNIVGILDDDSNKRGQRLNGVSILGSVDKVQRLAEQHNVDEIIIAIPSAKQEETKRILNYCKKTKAKIKILPSVYELIDGKVTVNQIREVKIEDLLGRDPVHLDTDLIEEYIKGKKILVTGGGGSIGSELCRQIARFKPKELIVLDIYENNVYDLQGELERMYNTFGFEKKLELKVIIASVRDRERIKQILKEHMPDCIFHAAAHKHVPLMEDNPYEAVKNNIVGTYNMVSLSDEFGISKFVMISTDKAVNPTNVMGATKRFCEMIIQGYANVSETDFVAVRFGNVLGSNGSVIPLFKRQIASGGPVTVTHKEVIRYFMTIPEASQLVLQAGAMARGGEIFILDMGEPVKIVELARDLIKLSGLVPDEDIQILFTGLRPGEKLFEELLLDEEDIEKTIHKKIFVGKPLQIKLEDIKKQVAILNETANLGEASLLILELQKFVDTYKNNQEINCKFLEE